MVWYSYGLRRGRVDPSASAVQIREEAREPREDSGKDPIPEKEAMSTRPGLARSIPFALFIGLMILEPYLETLLPGSMDVR